MSHADNGDTKCNRDTHFLISNVWEIMGVCTITAWLLESEAVEFGLRKDKGIAQMNIRAAILALALTPLTARAEMTIWNYGFVSPRTEDIVAGFGASLFQIDGAGFSGPVRTNAKDRLTFDLQFSIVGDTVSGTLRPEGDDSGVVELSGSRTLHTVPGDFPCTETVRMTGGNTYLLLARSHRECPP